LTSARCPGTMSEYRYSASPRFRHLALSALCLVSACAKASPNDSLGEASDSCDLAGVKTAIAERADVNPKLESGGLSPPMFASRSGCLDVAKHLLAAGANPNAQDSIGITSLKLASSGGYVALADALIHAGADVNAKAGYQQSTALGWAARYGRPEMTKALLAAGADVNSGGLMGTPLTESISSNKHTESGIHGNDYGTSEGHAAVERLLREHGAHQ